MRTGAGAEGSSRKVREETRLQSTGQRAAAAARMVAGSGEKGSFLAAS